MSKLIGVEPPDGESGEPSTPKIEFPCAYPIKVLGRNTVEFESMVVEVVLQHAPDFDRCSIVQRDSSRGSFCAITLTIRATGEPQLKALHAELQAIDAVKMVL